MKKIFLVWNLKMSECVGFLSEADAIYTSIGDRAAAESYPFVSSLGYDFREAYAEGEGDSDFDSTYEDAPEDLIILPMTVVEVPE